MKISCLVYLKSGNSLTYFHEGIFFIYFFPICICQLWHLFLMSVNKILQSRIAVCVINDGKMTCNMFLTMSIIVNAF